ncbi:MAG: glycosyltransferase family 2 protein [Vicinamibacteria bacterium]|nr:glycosyltransferase family 2 protein [Vicinamibacteria bacterium]
MSATRPAADRRVDVLLATYCRPHTIRYAIEAVLQQTHADFTLHVVGDGCDDETERIVRSFADPRLRFYRFPKAMGFGYVHRNTVLRQCDAPFVAYMTDDDLWFPDHLQRGVETLVERELGLVAFRSIQVRYPNLLDPYFFAFDWRLGPWSRWLRNWFMGAVGCVHRREVFTAVGYWDESLFRFGDRDFYHRVRVSPVPSSYEDRVTVLRFYAQHWDPCYALVAEPPQKAWVGRLREPGFRAEVEAALAGPRDLLARWRQADDFVAFAVRSGPRFLRFLFHKARAWATGSRR